MAVSIQIVVDDGQNVQIVEAGEVREALAMVLEGWKKQAVEPCSAGQKCKVLQQWIQQIERIMEG